MRKIVSKIDSSNNSERHYEIKILRKIAEEKHQIYFDERYSNLDLNNNNNNLINYWIVKRYSNEITHYLAHFFTYVKEDNKEESLTIFREYQNEMLTIMLEYLKDEQKSVQDLLDEFNRKTLLISSKKICIIIKSSSNWRLVVI